MHLIDVAKAHWETVAAQRSLYVPEWETTVYWTPLNMLDRERLSKDNEKLGSNSAGINLLIRALKDKEGQPLFTLEHKPALLANVDPDVLFRIMEEVMGAPSQKEAVENS